MHHADFVHLHLHSQYSLLDGAIRPAALVEEARRLRMPAVAVTDHGNLFGAVDFYEKAMAGGVKPIIGCEAYVAPGSLTERKVPGARGPSAFHLVLLVKNSRGYRNLCRLLTRAYIEGFYYRPRMDKTLLREMNEGLIAMSACLQGEVAFHLRRGDFTAALDAAAEYRDIFSGRRFFLELQNNGIEEQVEVNRQLVEIARKLDIPLVATGDCHYLKREDSKAHDVLLCIQTGSTVAAKERMRFPTDQFYLKSPEEMARAFCELPEAIKNTVQIAERCNFELELGRPHLPDFPVPEGKTLDELIDEEAKRGLERRLSSLGPGVESVRLKYYDRLERELRVIKGMGFPGYFLIVADFINFAKSKNIPVGPGRGSAAGSLVAWSLGITDLDPIRYNLLFERFLNPDRVSLPDIDIDFCYEKRDEVIRYVTEKYGPGNVTQIITFGQMKARAVIRDVGRVLELPYAEVDRIAKLIPPQVNITIDEALEKEPRLKNLVEEDSRVAELIDYARALEGLPRHASTHAAGVVISNRPLVEYLPLYKGQKDEVTTQYSMKDVEKIGLVKFDFLGLKTLTVIQKTIELIAAAAGTPPDMDNLPLDDEATYRTIASADTDGVFQLESSGMKDLLKKLKPSSFEDLTAAVALFRPGPLQSGMVDEFIKRKNGQTRVTYDLPQLKEILEKTYGVIVYQEQVMEIARTLAGFTPGEADVLRKAMGKKRTEDMVRQRSRFLEGAEKAGVPARKAEKIFNLMAKFAEYGFNKSHSAAYALIAYRTAYLKTRHRAEFMAALLTSEMGNTDQVVKYVADCRAAGIAIEPPHINESAREFTVTEGRIRFGLGAVKNVGASAIEEIVRARDEAPFESIVDFLSRVDTRKVNRKVIESLIKCGAFDFTGFSRTSLLACLDSLMEEAQGIQRDRALGQKSIFDVIGGGPAAATAPPPARPAAAGEAPGLEREIQDFEKETLGFYFSSHPLTGMEEKLKLATTSTVEGLGDLPDGASVTVGGVVTGMKEINTKKGRRMAFVRIDDTTGGVEAVLFPDVYASSMETLSDGRPVVASGRLDRSGEEAKLIAEEVSLLEEAGCAPKKTHIYMESSLVEEGRLESLKRIFTDHPGPSPVFLHILYPDRRCVVIDLSGRFNIEPLSAVLEEIKVAAGATEVTAEA